MKRGIKYLFAILCSFVLVSCGPEKEIEVPKTEVTININDTVEQGYLDLLTIKSNDIEGTLDDFNYHISLSNDNLVYYNKVIFSQILLVQLNLQF